MVSLKNLDDLREIAFQVPRNITAYMKTPEGERLDHLFFQQIRKVAFDIENWCDDKEFKR